AEIALQNAQKQGTTLEKIEKGEINWGEIQKAQRVLEKPRKDLENAKSELEKDKCKVTSLLETVKKGLTKLSQRDSSGNLEVKGILATINDYENQLAGNVLVPAGVGLEKPVFASTGNLLTSRPFGYQGRLGDSRLAKLFQSLQGLVGVIAPWASVSKLRLKYGVMEANALLSGRMDTEYETSEQVRDDVIAKSAQKNTLILVVNDGQKRNYLHVDLPSLAAKAAEVIPGMGKVTNEKGDLPIMTGSIERKGEEIDPETWLLKPGKDELSYGVILPIHLNEAEVGLALPITKNGKVYPAYVKFLRKGVGGYNKVAENIKIERIIAGRAGSPTDRFRSEKANLDMARAVYQWMDELFPGNRVTKNGLKKIADEKLKQRISIAEEGISREELLANYDSLLDKNPQDLYDVAIELSEETNEKDEKWLYITHMFHQVHLLTKDSQTDLAKNLNKTAKKYFFKSAGKAANVFFEQGSIHKGISGLEETLNYAKHAVTTGISMYFPEWGLCSGIAIDGFISCSQHNFEDHKIQKILRGEYLDGHSTSKSVGARTFNEFPEFLQRQAWAVKEVEKEFEQTGSEAIWQKFMNVLAAYPTKQDVKNLKDKTPEEVMKTLFSMPELKESMIDDPGRSIYEPQGKKVYYVHEIRDSAKDNRYMVNARKIDYNPIENTYTVYSRYDDTGKDPQKANVTVIAQEFKSDGTLKNVSAVYQGRRNPRTGEISDEWKMWTSVSSDGSYSEFAYEDQKDGSLIVTERGQTEEDMKYTSIFTVSKAGELVRTRLITDKGEQVVLHQATDDRSLNRLRYQLILKDTTMPVNENKGKVI
ncbi:MAG: hypothetical protein ABIH09_05255, partial [Candidatus Omnitrophota bacterium]